MVKNMLVSYNNSIDGVKISEEEKNLIREIRKLNNLEYINKINDLNDLIKERDKQIVDLVKKNDVLSFEIDNLKNEILKNKKSEYDKLSQLYKEKYISLFDYLYVDQIDNKTSIQCSFGTNVIKRDYKVYKKCDCCGGTGVLELKNNNTIICPYCKDGYKDSDSVRLELLNEDFKQVIYTGVELKDNTLKGFILTREEKRYANDLLTLKEIKDKCIRHNINSIAEFFIKNTDVDHIILDTYSSNKLIYYRKDFVGV